MLTSFCLATRRARLLKGTWQGKVELFELAALPSGKLPIGNSSKRERDHMGQKAKAAKIPVQHKGKAAGAHLSSKPHVALAVIDDLPHKCTLVTGDAICFLLLLIFSCYWTATQRRSSGAVVCLANTPLSFRTKRLTNKWRVPSGSHQHRNERLRILISCGWR